MRAILFLFVVACGSTATDDGPTDTSDTSGAQDTAAEVASDENNRDGVCDFNRECPADQRCECADGLCACADGARGTGVNGVDTCTDGNDCASSLCIEGETLYYCSDECGTNKDCGPNLPDCIDIAFVGRVCVRDQTI